MLTIKEASPFSEDVRKMIGLLDQYQQELYPAESNHLDPIEVLAEPNCKLMGAYYNNELVGIGAAKIMDNYGELKRFYVPEKFRGQGVAESIIAALEDWLIGQNIKSSHLETGIHQHAAIRFYQKLGYVISSPFGNYKPDPLSVFMEKRLDNFFESQTLIS